MYNDDASLACIRLVFEQLIKLHGTKPYEEDFDVEGGYAFKSKDYTKDGTFVLRVTNINPDGTITKGNNEKFINDEQLINDLKSYTLEANDILIVMVGGSLGKVGKVSEDALPALLNQNLWKIKNPKQINNDYVFYLSLYLNEFKAVVKTSSFGHFSRLKYRKLEIPDITFDDCERAAKFISSICVEKKIISDKIFESIIPSITKILNVVSNTRVLKTEIEYQIKLLKNLRQQLLQDAVQGKLVPQNPKDEPASELLKKIKAEKEQLIKDKKLKKEKELPPITEDEIPFEIPENWVWCRLGDICTRIGSGSTPNGSNYSLNGKPFFRSQNIYNEGLVYEDIKFITDETHKKMRGTIVYANDILLNITGGSMGRCALVPDNFEEGNVSQHVCIIRPLFVDVEFYHSLILSPFFQNLIFSSTTGAGREGLPKYNLEQFLIPIPPLAEQIRIAKKIKLLMQTCDALEASIKESTAQNEQLLQQVLREALGGKK